LLLPLFYAAPSLIFSRIPRKWVPSRNSYSPCKTRIIWGFPPRVRAGNEALSRYNKACLNWAASVVSKPACDRNTNRSVPAPNRPRIHGTRRSGQDVFGTLSMLRILAGNIRVHGRVQCTRLYTKHFQSRRFQEASFYRPALAKMLARLLCLPESSVHSFGR
jgi:hypothetical protein